MRPLLFLWLAAVGVEGRGYLPHFDDLRVDKPDARVGQGELVFLQALWRHGDRTPTVSFPKDTNTWDRDWGQLTTTGMKQHIKLGSKLRQRYIDSGFLNKYYDSKEIYVRSTDVNRTLISAISNMIGFYGSNSQKGKDYPDDPAWPNGYVPVPIHTIDNRRDYPGNVDRPCPRTGKLVKLAGQTEYFKQVEAENEEFLKHVSDLAGIEIHLQNIWVVYDALYIEKIYNKSVAGFTEEIFQKLENLSMIVDDIDFGIRSGQHKAIDLSKEIAKVRGGPILWTFIDNIQQKLYCLNTPQDQRDKQGASLCHWIEPLKYHVYSAHDTTLASLFATFGFNETNYDHRGFPHYSAAVTVELRKDSNGTYFVNVVYWPPDVEGSVDVTDKIEGCVQDCPLDTFVQRSQPYNPGHPEELCQKVDDLNSVWRLGAGLLTTLAALAVTRLGL